MGVVAKENFVRGQQQLVNYNEELNVQIDADENCLDQFADKADRFMIGLSKRIETSADDKQVDMLLQTVPNFERVGDYATNFAELGQRLSEQNAVFSDMAKKELAVMFDAVNEILDITVSAFLNDDMELARKIEPLEEVIDDMVLILRDRHTKRLKNGECTVETGLVFMEVLTYLERASDQCSSIAVMMIARYDEAVLQNHYEYLRNLHAGSDAGYVAEKERRRDQFITPLLDVR